MGSRLLAVSAPDPNGPIVLPQVFIDLCSYSGELSGWLAPTLLGVVSVALLAASVFWARRRRRSGRSNRALWWGAGVSLGVGVLLTLALAVNSWVGYVPSFSALGRWLGGAEQSVDLSGTLGSGDRVHTTAEKGASFQVRIPATADRVPSGDAWVYLPPGYDQSADSRYRVVIGLHGDPGKGADWFAAGDIATTLDTLIAAGALPPIIFVSPDLSAGTGVNYREPVNVPNGPAIEDYVSGDIVDWVDSSLRTVADVQDRVIAGFSSGGFGSLVIGLRHSDVFGGIVSIIPYTVPYTTAIKDDPQLLSEYDPSVAIAHATRIPPTFLGMAGLETPKNGNKLAAALTARDATFTKRVFDGQPHTWQTARIIMPYGLVWVAQQLGWVSPLAGEMSGFPQACQPDPN